MVSEQGEKSDALVGRNARTIVADTENDPTALTRQVDINGDGWLVVMLDGIVDQVPKHQRQGWLWRD